MADQGKILSAVSEYVEAETAELKAQILQLTAQRDSARGDVADLTTKVAELQAELDALEQKMLVGISYPSLAKGVAPSPYEARADVARIFWQTNVGGLNMANDPRVVRALANGVKTLVVSWHDEDTARVQAFLATRPQGVTIYACVHHEPEDDNGAPGTAAYQAWSAHWKQVWLDQSPLIRAAGCIPTQILMAYTLRAASKRSLADWLAPAGTVDVLGWDAYINAYDPADQVGVIVTACKTAGIARAAIMETGSVVGDTQRGTKLAALHQAMADANTAGDVQFEVACYWNQIQGQYDFRLNDADADVWFAT